MIRLEGISKSFAGKPAVTGIDLHVPRGSVFGLLGHNGAGKSTTLGMVLGQVLPDVGSVLVNGHDVFTNRAAALGRVGAIFEAPAFFDYLSGARNLQSLCALSGNVSDAEVRDVVRLVGLETRIHDKVATYSHGMRQRLGLAQALLPQPELLILDEPGDGLDPEGLHEVRDLIRRLHHERGMTILFSSHLLAEVEQVCSHVAVMRRGELLFAGPWANVETEEDGRWFHLHADPWDQAITLLRQQNMIRNDNGTDRIQLTTRQTPAQVNATLVHAGVEVHAFAPYHRTLEDFYMELTTPPN